MPSLGGILAGPPHQALHVLPVKMLKNYCGETAGAADNNAGKGSVSQLGAIAFFDRFCHIIF